MTTGSRKYVVLSDEDWATLTDLATAAGTNRPGWVRAAIAGAVRTGTLATGPVVHQASGLQVAVLPSAVPAVSWRHDSGAHGTAIFEGKETWVVRYGEPYDLDRLDAYQSSHSAFMEIEPGAELHDVLTVLARRLDSASVDPDVLAAHAVAERQILAVMTRNPDT